MLKRIPGFFLFFVVVAGVRAGEWRELFNGDDLTGWTFDVLDHSDPTEIFSAADGLIRINGEGKPTAVMQTEASFGAFELTFEWRWPGKPGNSGCLLYCSTLAEVDRGAGGEWECRGPDHDR